MAYEARKIEQKWQKIWEERKTFHTDIDPKKKKYYVLDMFPYPSGSGLHVGHPLGYIASDIISRHKRMQGYQVLHPMGYDAFGLPAEQYAIQHGIHPAKSTSQNIERFRAQLKNIGLSYDWSREINTSDPSYYKWTQHIFLLLFSHYYNVVQQKAMPIDHLIDTFHESGSAHVHAYHTNERDFTAAEWQAFSAKEKDDILMHYRLAYRKTSFVNWCEELGTVLANDEVINGRSERGGYPVIQKPMLQWALRVTAYAERLLAGLESLDWSEALKIQQENWIGKSTGAMIRFPIAQSDKQLEVYTTRPDTIFGCTFMVIAPEHPLVETICSHEQSEVVDRYVKDTARKSTVERMADKSVSGAFTGAYAVHPFTDELLPIYISEYVLYDYGTGAIMAVPSNDERDERFATHFALPIKKIIDTDGFDTSSIEDQRGRLQNSDFLNGLTVSEAIDSVISKLEEKQIGNRKVNYKLRDANFSRQRYWGEPFPIIYDNDGVAHAVPKEDLPVTLPKLDNITPTGGQSPLLQAKAWLNTVDGYRRESDTMPGFAGSSWYFLRYMDPWNQEDFASPSAVHYWQDVDCYVGGTEHAVGHLIYARFWHKFLFDMGLVPTEEPFKKLINQGMIQGRSLYLQINKDGAIRDLHIPISLADEKDRLYKQDFITLTQNDNRFEDVDPNTDLTWQRDETGQAFVTLRPEVEKMSKSKYNVINPDDVIQEYGADCFRLFEMFLGPIEDHKPWDTQSITGVSKFLHRFWSLFHTNEGEWNVVDEKPSRKELKILHTCIKKVNEDIERYAFNTCIAAMMIAVNELRSLSVANSKVLSPLVCLLSPFAPHMAEELWAKLGHTDSVCYAPFPEHNEEFIKESEIEYPICINGKKRSTASFPADMSKKDLASSAQRLESIQKWIDAKTIRKVIVVPGRMINIVVA